MQCNRCRSKEIQKYGRAKMFKGGKVLRVQQYRCYNCGYQFRDKR